MAIHPKDDIGLVVLRRDRAGVEKNNRIKLCSFFLIEQHFI